MILISHRGNLNGPNAELENKPDYIYNALHLGFDVEIDVWKIKNNWYLGHDEPKYKINFNLLKNKKFWVHAKNGDAFYTLYKNIEINSFWHTNENWILTTHKYIWTYPGQTLYPKSICVLPELGYNGILKKCLGICSDFIVKYKIT